LMAPLALIGVLALSACTNKPAAGNWSGGSQPSGAPIGSGQPSPGTGSAPAAGGATITAPTDGAKDVLTAVTISYTGDATTAVKLTDANGKDVPGGAGYDPSTWIPNEQLDYGKTYTATINGGSPVKFTTMGAPAGKTAGVHSATGDGQVLGVGAVIVLTLDHAVASANQAAFEKRLSVTSTPAQEGTWSWINDREVHYRPKVHWQPGTKIFADAKTGGLPIGNGYFARNDLTIDTSIATNGIEITVDDKVHQLYVYQSGKLIKTFPASNGKASTPSSSGNFLIMSRMPEEIFDSSLGTGGIPVGAPGAYREKVLWTERLTWGGEYIHAAPWSVGDQGHRDVSHGCTNVSTANAKWIYDHSHIGDPVTVKNTLRKVTLGNGWTDWTLSWDAYQKNSALH